MLNALHAVRSPNQRLIMVVLTATHCIEFRRTSASQGMDANAHRGNKSKRSLHVADLGAGLRGLRLASSFGDPPDDEMVGRRCVSVLISSYWNECAPLQVTTCMARTFLQPQFNKVGVEITSHWSD